MSILDNSRNRQHQYVLLLIFVRFKINLKKMGTILRKLGRSIIKKTSFFYCLDQFQIEYFVTSLNLNKTETLCKQSIVSRFFFVFNFRRPKPIIIHKDVFDNR